MGGEAAGPAEVAAGLVDLQVLATYGIAINLAYLNLSNLRYAQRIRERIRQIFDQYPYELYEHINANDPRYKRIYVLGELGEVPAALGPLKKPGDIRAAADDTDVILFMSIWCTQVRFIHATQPVDKLLSSALLVICSLYLYYLVAQTIGDLSVDHFDFLFYCFIAFAAIAMIAYAVTKSDYVTSSFGLLVMAYCISTIHWYSYRLVFQAVDHGNAVVVLSLSVLIPTVLVVVSNIIYRRAEAYYAGLTKGIFDDAQERRQPTNGESRSAKRVDTTL